MDEKKYTELFFIHFNIPLALLIVHWIHDYGQPIPNRNRYF